MIFFLFCFIYNIDGSFILLIVVKYFFYGSYAIIIYNLNQIRSCQIYE